MAEELRAAEHREAPHGTRRSIRAPQFVEDRLAAAAKAYSADRYEEARAALLPVMETVPGAPAAKELYGLTLYRLGRWREAARQLRQLFDITGSYDQHPVIADCERALGRLDQVTRLWDELRRAGVDREVLIEGRLVMAGALADAGRLGEATALLLPEAANRRNPDLGHLRQWYALADLHERAGDLPRARELFARVVRADPSDAGARDRLAALR